jgi:hypothetical protein
MWTMNPDNNGTFTSGKWRGLIMTSTFIKSQSYKYSWDLGIVFGK